MIQLSSSRRVLLGTGLGIAAALAVSVVTLTGSSGSNAATASGFPEGVPSVPALAEQYPMASTIHRVAVGVPGVTAWIAESYGGGVCALASVGGSPAAIGFSCSLPSRREQGVGVELREIPSMPGKVLKVGVAPDGTAEKTLNLPSGSTVSVPVSGNAWAYMTTGSGG
jgi:hypothetical protein